MQENLFEVVFSFSTEVVFVFCFFSSVFLLQSIVTDLSYTVRSPVLDKWEGIKQLKAALWALVSNRFTKFLQLFEFCYDSLILR